MVKFYYSQLSMVKPALNICRNICKVWDITPCSPLKVNRHFGGTCRLHLQGRKISRTRKQRESKRKTVLLANCFHARVLVRLILQPWRWRRYVSVTSVDFQRTTQCYIPEDSSLHNHQCRNLKYYKLIYYTHNGQVV
jgi:hypothetical protein